MCQTPGVPDSVSLARKVFCLTTCGCFATLAVVASTSKKTLRVLIAASEGVPFSKTGGLGDVIGALPPALASLGVKVAVVLPRYRGTKLGDAKCLVSSATIPLGNRLHFPRILEAADKKDGVRWFFVDYPPFYDRDSLYVASDGKDYPDNPERFGLLSRCVLEIAKTIFPPDLIHCHDWQAGLTPVFLRTVYAEDPVLKGIPTIITIHNLGYQGLFPADALSRIGLGPELFHMSGLEFYGQVNILKGALVYSDALTTVSRKYSREIQTPEYGHGLEGVLQERADRIRGILNGADYAEWDPSVDHYIAAPYSTSKLQTNNTCKKNFLQSL